MREIRKVGVLGSGVMGAAIAAHLGNCGIPSVMLDIVPPNLADKDKDNKAKRDSIAAGAKAALFKAKPSPIYRKSVPGMIEVGNFDDDMHKMADCDWIIEVVKEDLNIKKKVFENLKQHRTPGTIVSSNTSGIAIKSMVDVMDDDFRQHFLGTHFFNPPRYLKLLEIIPGPDTKPEVIDFMAKFLENRLGKGVVYAKDTPNFIANRIITFAMSWIGHEMKKDGLSVEEVDALTGPAIGHASSATFRTADLVGLDTLLLVIGNVVNNCPGDERLETIKPPEFFQKMVDKGLLGTKSGSGFYRKTNRKDEKGKSLIEGIDIETVEYRDPVKPRFECTGAVRNVETLEEKLKIMHEGEDKGAQFVWKMFANVAIYAANRIPEIADDIVNIDNAVKWGFAWDVGIFETWDILGFEKVCARMESEGMELPPIAKAMKEAGATSFFKTEGGKHEYFDLGTKSYQPVPMNPNILILKDLKDQNKVVKSNEGATLIDLGDGIICCEFHTKMNALDDNIGNMLKEGVDLVNEGRFEGMVVANQGDHFCAGANIFVLLGNAMQGAWDAIENMVSQFQQVQQHMRFCRGPVVAAPHHYTFGGGMEVAMHAAKAVLAGETYGGLVEVGVGLIPAGGGCKELVRRSFEEMPENVDEASIESFLTRAFMNIAMARVGTSAGEVIDYGYLKESDIILPNFDQQVQKAKDTCRALLLMGYVPPAPARLTALGEPLRAIFKAGIYPLRKGGYASEYDEHLAMKIGHILSGGDRLAGATITEQDLLDLEREAFVSLCGQEKTQQRIQHMLTTGKPLRN